jgi:hypothetical protein
MENAIRAFHNRKPLTGPSIIKMMRSFQEAKRNESNKLRLRHTPAKFDATPLLKTLLMNV